jgi:hypothetical protein
MRKREQPPTPARFVAMAKLAPFALVVTAAALLAACSEPAPQPAAPKAGTGETGYIAKVQALSAGQRAGVLFRAIEKSGGKGCQGVTQVENMPPSSTGQPTWRVTCEEGSQWMVALSDDGTALVTGARDYIHLNQ